MNYPIPSQIMSTLSRISGKGNTHPLQYPGDNVIAQFTETSITPFRDRNQQVRICACRALISPPPLCAAHIVRTCDRIYLANCINCITHRERRRREGGDFSAPETSATSGRSCNRSERCALVRYAIARPADDGPPRVTTSELGQRAPRTL